MHRQLGQGVSERRALLAGRDANFIERLHVLAVERPAARMVEARVDVGDAQRNAVALRTGKIHAQDCESCETKEGMIDRIERAITLRGPLDAEQRRRLLEIADKCPVHRTLTSEVKIRTVERPEDGETRSA